MMAAAVSACPGVVVVFGASGWDRVTAESTSAGGMRLEVATADGSLQGLFGN
jgi:hypothetical protein